jgi:hypothetical protein
MIGGAVSMPVGLRKNKNYGRLLLKKNFSRLFRAAPTKLNMLEILQKFTEKNCLWH